MPGINLSQSASIAEKSEERLNASSKAVYASLGLLLVVALGYGVLWYFSYSLDQKQTAITQKIQETKASYASALVFRVARFSIKSDAAVTKRIFPDVNPVDELRVMSENIIPDVVLDSYENDLSSNTVKISGQANTFLQVAQQMKIFQDSGNFSSISLNEPLLKDDKGKIGFSLSLARVIDPKKNK